MKITYNETLKKTLECNNEKDLKEFEKILNENLCKIYDFNKFGIFAKVNSKWVDVYDGAEQIISYSVADNQKEYELEQIISYIITQYIKVVQAKFVQRGKINLKNQVQDFLTNLDI